MKKTIEYESFTVALYYEQDSGSDHIIYAFVSEEECEKAIELLHHPLPVIACINGYDWNRDLTPWRESRVFPGEDDFGGKADDLISALVNEIAPRCEAVFPNEFIKRSICGYSLSGLFSLYALFKTDFFSSAASVSGSLWYNGFCEYIEEKRPIADIDKVYISLGDREKMTRNPLIKTVESCTEKAVKQFNDYGADVLYELNPGNHFFDIPKRISKAFEFLS